MSNPLWLALSCPGLDLNAERYAYRYIDKGIGDEQMAIPMQDHTSLKVSSHLYGSNTLHNLLILLLQQDSFGRWKRSTAKPLFIERVDVDWAIERSCPGDVSRVEMRM